MEQFVLMLKEALNNPANRADIISAFQKDIWNTKAGGEPNEAFTILKELAYDLDFYQPDPALRKEDASYYGEERLVEEIADALKRIEAVGQR
jgi:hypothetical protein